MRAETFDCTVPSSREAREKPSASYTATKYRRSLTSIPPPRAICFFDGTAEEKSTPKTVAAALRFDALPNLRDAARPAHVRKRAARWAAPDSDLQAPRRV